MISISFYPLSNEVTLLGMDIKWAEMWLQTGRCEDAFFFSSKAAGVADGVGQMEQFSEYGVDAAKQLAPETACTWLL